MFCITNRGVISNMNLKNVTFRLFFSLTLHKRWWCPLQKRYVPSTDQMRLKPTIVTVSERLYDPLHTYLPGGNRWTTWNLIIFGRIFRDRYRASKVFSGKTETRMYFTSRTGEREWIVPFLKYAVFIICNRRSVFHVMMMIDNITAEAMMNWRSV